MITLSALFVALLLSACLLSSSSAFLVPPRLGRLQHPFQQTVVHSQRCSRLSASNYVPPEGVEQATPNKAKPLYPKVGDIVRYNELDGGKADGQVLVGKITFIQKNIGGERSGWTLEVTELEGLGDGFFADYPARQRRSKKSLRDAKAVSPISASFVGSENAFKVPRDPATGLPRSRVEQYDVDGYEGPFSGDNAIDLSVLEADEAIYQALKGKLIQYAAITGLAGALIADLTKGTEAAIIYAGGVVASLLYLVLLSLKTDTIASNNEQLGARISGLRFVMPFLVLIGVATYNSSLGDANPVQGQGPFDTVTSGQLAAATLGFLTYRLPLFALNLQEAFKSESGEVILPGSAGIAMQLAKEDKSDEDSFSKLNDDGIATVFLVSGPQATGRSELVKRLFETGEGRFVEPYRIDRTKDGETFDQLQKREAFLSVDPTGRYGITGEGILKAARQCGPDSVVVVDADVKLANQIAKLPNLRLVGVWVGLNSVTEFEKRILEKINSGEIAIPEDNTKESVLRARIKEIVQEIEFGISSGLFDFTVLNEDPDSSVKQLMDAASYCFR